MAEKVAKAVDPEFSENMVGEDVSGQVTIRPVKGSRSFTTVSAIIDHSVVAKDKDGEEISESKGTYDGERFWDSVQTFRPEFDTDAGQFDIRHRDGRLWDNNDAKKCLELFPLSYEKGQRKGELIDKVNIRDVEDAYFNHKGLERKAEEGFLTLNTRDPRDAMLLDMYSGNGDVGTDDGEEAIMGDLRYLISNPEAEEKKIEVKLQDFEDAADAFKSMKDDKPRMIGILRLFGEEPANSLSLGMVRQMLGKYVTDDKTTDAGATYQKRFNMYASLPKDQLQLRELIQLGLNDGSIGKRAGTYMFADSPIGRSYKEVVEFFDKNTNQREDLEMRMKKRK